MKIIPESWILGRKPSPRKIIKEALKEISEQEKVSKKLDEIIKEVEIKGQNQKELLEPEGS